MCLKQFRTRLSFWGMTVMFVQWLHKCHTEWKCWVSVSDKVLRRVIWRQCLFVFLFCIDHNSTAHYEFAQQGQAVIQHCYFVILMRLYIMTMHLLMIHLLSRSLWPKIDTETGPSTIFTTFGYSQNWRLLWRATDFQGHAMTILKRIRKEFQICFEQWINRFTKCNDMQEDYFRSDSDH